MIDLRSDFLARPTASMIEAMVAAAREEQGFGLRENPSVQRLERRAAEVLGKEDALFCPTCTQCNQIAINHFCRPGDTLVTESQAHVLTSEGGAPGALSGALVRAIAAEAGTLDLAELGAALIREEGSGRPPVGLVVIENTHVRSGGTVLSEDHMAAVRELAQRAGVPVHLDGARIFNAAAYLGVPAARLAGYADTVAVSLNKGLCAPMGAVLAGPVEVVAAAVDIRQRLGGGWRPAGIPAAAAVVALDEMVGRLAEDHERARRLAEGVGAIDGLTVVNAPVPTNIVLVSVDRPGMSAERCVEQLREKGVLTRRMHGSVIRLVTHNDIADADVEAAVDAFREVLAG